MRGVLAPLLVSGFEGGGAEPSVKRKRGTTNLGLGRLSHIPPSACLRLVVFVHVLVGMFDSHFGSNWGLVAWRCLGLRGGGRAARARRVFGDLNSPPVGGMFDPFACVRVGVPLALAGFLCAPAAGYLFADGVGALCAFFVVSCRQSVSTFAGDSSGDDCGMPWSGRPANIMHLFADSGCVGDSARNCQGMLVLCV